MIEYRTTDTNELAPHPGMTADDLADFEAFAEDVERQYGFGRFWDWITRRRPEPTTFQKCLAVHMHSAANKGALSE
jgi:hypothetical protein